MQGLAGWELALETPGVGDEGGFQGLATGLDQGLGLAMVHRLGHHGDALASRTMRRLYGPAIYEVCYALRLTLLLFSIACYSGAKDIIEPAHLGVDSVWNHSLSRGGMCRGFHWQVSHNDNRTQGRLTPRRGSAMTFWKNFIGLGR